MGIFQRMGTFQRMGGYINTDEAGSTGLDATGVSSWGNDSSGVPWSSMLRTVALALFHLHLSVSLTFSLFSPAQPSPFTPDVF